MAHTKAHTRAHKRAHIFEEEGAPVDEPDEFITNGAFDADTDWTKAATWSISGGVATHNGLAPGNLSQVFIPGALITGNTYNYSITVTNPLGCLWSVRIRQGAAGTIQSVKASGSQTGLQQGQFVATTTHDRIIIMGEDDFGDSFSIDDVSITPT